MKISVLISLCAVAFLLTGCDWVRGTLGMPTSDQIKVKREQIARLKADSSARAQRIADSLAILKRQADSIKMQEQHLQGGFTVLEPSQLSDNYYVIVGSYLKESNVLNAIERFDGVLGTPVVIRGVAGMVMVAAAGYSQSREAYSACFEIYDKEPDAWVYKAK